MRTFFLGVIHLENGGPTKVEKSLAINMNRCRKFTNIFSQRKTLAFPFVGVVRDHCSVVQLLCRDKLV